MQNAKIWLKNGTDGHLTVSGNNYSVITTVTVVSRSYFGNSTKTSLEVTTSRY